MKTGVIIRLSCITILFVLLCAFIINRMVKIGTPLNLMTLFPFIAAAIIVFVPLYKKYIKNEQGKK